jgi:outer membrane receptor protein involved in Fe transport
MLSAQQPNRGGNLSKTGDAQISGRIIDEQTKKPVHYASVYIYRTMKDTTLITGAISKEDGSFVLENLPYGKFRIEIKFIGYQKYDIDNIILSPKNTPLDIGEIKFTPIPVTAEGIVVEAEREYVSYDIDKKVFNVSKDLSAAGGSAIDVMQNIPSITVDIEGNVSMRGNSSVNILIDGKPSSLMSVDQATALEQIPAENIDRIELITNPSAKYDPEGVTGIINIIMKKNDDIGYNGMVSVNVGTKDKYNGNINLNVRKGDFNTFLNYGVRLGHMPGTSTVNTTSIVNDTTYTSEQNGESDRKHNFHNFRGGIDFTIDGHNFILSSGYGFSDGRSRDTTSYIDANLFEGITSLNTQNNASDNDGKNFDLSLNYKKPFTGKMHELTADVVFSSFSRTGSTNYSRYYYDGLQNFYTIFNKNYSDNLSSVLTLQTDYSRPFGDDSRLDMGAKAVLRTIDNDFKYYDYDTTSQDWLVNYDNSKHFKYHENVVSAYFTFQDKISNLGYQVGLRAEETITDITTTKNDSQQNLIKSEGKNDYLSLFPTLHLKYNLSEVNSVNLSYSRRITRPSFRSLDPFIDNTDPRNISYGNPDLKPEYSDALEFGYLFYLPTTSVNISAFYRYTKDMITRFSTLVDSITTVTTYGNLNSGYSLGLELIATQNFGKWWRINGSISSYHAEIDKSSQYTGETKSWSWNGRINSTFNIFQIVDLQLMFNYRSPSVMLSSSRGLSGGPGGGGPGGGFGPQGFSGKSKEDFSLDLGLKIDLFNGNGSINLRARDILQTSKFASEYYGTDFSYVSERLRESPIIFLGFSYKFNEYKRAKERNIDEDSYREQNNE